MDAAYFGLTRNPFERDPGLDEACLPPPLADLVQDLVDGLQFPRTISIVVGEAGAGKSTLASVLASTLGRDAAVARITAGPAELDAVLAEALQQLEPRLARDDGFVPSLEALARSTANRRENGIPTVVILDDAHRLRPDAIENLCRNAHAHVILFGHPVLLEKLGGVLDPNAGPETPIDPVRVRSVKPLTRGFALGYLADRVAAAGGRIGGLFTPSALARMVDATNGLTTRLEEVAAVSLDEAQEAGQHEVGIDLVERVLTQSGAGRPRETTVDPEARAFPAPVPIGRAVPPHAPPAVAGRPAGAGGRPAAVEARPPVVAGPPPSVAGPPGVEVPTAATRRAPEPVRDDFLRFSDPSERPPLRIPRAFWLGAIGLVLLVAIWIGFSDRGGREGPATSVFGGEPEAAPMTGDSAAATAPAETTVAAIPPPGPPALTRPDAVTRPDAGTPPAAGTRPSADLRDGWVVQVGAFRSRRNAEGVVVKLRQVDPGATIRVRGGLHYVVTSPLASEADATAFSRRVQARGFSTFVRRWVEGR